MSHRSLSMVLLVVSIVVGSFVVGTSLGQQRGSSLSALRQARDRSAATLLIADTPVKVEVVTSADSIILGLSGRSEIGSDGMLFVLPERRVASFWMKDMLIHLDMIWIDEGAIAHISADVPAPSETMPLYELPTYSSQYPVTHVLEVPAGTAKKHGWVVGSTVNLVSY